MIEYLYDAIRATSGTDITIAAEIEDDGELVNDTCHLVLHINDEMKKYEGVCVDGIWEFIIPAADTSGLTGRYWYCVKRNDTMLCFKQPIYLV